MTFEIHLSILLCNILAGSSLRLMLLRCIKVTVLSKHYSMDGCSYCYITTGSVEMAVYASTLISSNLPISLISI